VDNSGNIATGQANLPAGLISVNAVVTDNLGLTQSTGPFNIVIAPAVLVVSTLADENDGNFSPGHLSLREAVQIADMRAGADTITFDPALTASGAATITLTQDNLLLTDTTGKTTIQGPGANLLTISGNDQYRVFRVIPNAELDISGLTIAHGKPAVGDGGGIDNFGTLTVTDCTFTSNNVDPGDGVGGGIANFGTLTVNSSTFADNFADLGTGGGVYNFSDETAIITSSTFTGDSAVGGAAVDNRGSLTVTNSTFTANTASDGGGAIRNAGLLMLLDSTVVANQALTTRILGGGGGGLALDNEATTVLHDSIVAGNTSNNASNNADDISGAPVDASSSFNLIGDVGTSGGLQDGVQGNIVGQHGFGTLDTTTILDQTLRDNGGPTQTLALILGSPAINAGDPNFDPNAFTPPLAYDQRGPGFPRVQLGRIDIGAFEAPPTAPTITSANRTPFFVGQPGSFVFQATGLPVPKLSETGALPPGVTFQDNGDGTATLSGTPGDNSAKSYVLTITASNGVGNDASQTFTVTVNRVTLVVGPTNSPLLQDVPTTVYHTPTGLIFSILHPFPGYTGGVSVAAGDINGDGVPDIVAAASSGAAPEVGVIDGKTGAILADFFAFAPSFTGGVSVAVGDVNGDGRADIIVGAGAGGGPEVKVLDGTKLNQILANGEIAQSAVLADFFAFAPSFTGGVNVAAGDVNGDGRADVIVGAGSGGAPEVKVVDASKLNQLLATGEIAPSALLGDFFAFAPIFTGGVSVAAADVNGDGRADVIVGAGPGGGPEVKVLDSTKLANGGIAPGALLGDFFAFAPAFAGGVSVAAADVNGDGRADVIVGAGPGGGPEVRVFDPSTAYQIEDDFFAFSPTAGVGVNVAVALGIPLTASVSLDAAHNFVLQDTTPDSGKAEAPTIQVDSANQQYVISDPNTIFSASVGSVSSDGHTVTVPFAAVAGQFIFNSNQGNDTLTVDFSKGSWAGHTIVFNGGSGSNTLNVIGGTFSKQQFDYTNAHDGDELLTDAAGTTTIDYTHLKPIDNSGTAADIVFNLPAGAQASLEDSGTATDGISQLRSLNNSFELTTFANPTNSLTINTAGNSTVQLAPIDSGFAPVTESFQGQATDTFQFTSANAVPSATAINLSTATLDLLGLSPTVAGISGSGTVTSSTAGAETLTLNVGKGSSDTFSGVIQDGSGTVSLIKSGAGTETLGGTNTYTGATTINGGTLTVTGTLNNLAMSGAGLVSLNAAGVTLNGSGTVNGQVTVTASSFASPSQIQQLTITVPTSGTGITVAATAAFVQIGTTSGVTVNGGNAASTGVLVQGSALIENSTISDHHVDVNVNGGSAALQNTHMDTNFPSADATLVTGLLVQGGGIVDAGQLAAAAKPLPGGPAGNVGYYGDITGLFSGMPLGTTAHSSGGNTFNGYALDTSATAILNPGPTFPQAIRDQNTGTASFGDVANGVEQSFNYGSAGPELGRMDVTAQGNTWNGNASLPLFQIEQLIFHDNDDPNVGFVSFGNSTAPASVVVGNVNYVANVSPNLTDVQSGRGILFAGANLLTGQKSIIRYIQVTYSSSVFLAPNFQSATGNFGLNLIEVDGPNFQEANTNPANGRLIHATIVSSVYNRANGNETVIYGFTGPGTEFGSLEDGNYQLQFNESAIQGGGPGGPGLSPAGDPFAVQAAQFYRLFGDVTGDRMVDNTDLAQFQAAFESRIFVTSYRSYFDYDGNGVIDSADYSEFQRRMNTQLSPVATIQPNTVYVDDSWAGTANNTEPATDPTAGGILLFGFNAFADIQSGINAIAAGGTVVVYGGSYTAPSTLNISKSVGAFEVSVNPDIPAETTVNINEAVTLTSSATFVSMGVDNSAAPANLTFGSTVDSGATAQSLTVTSAGAGNSITFNGAIGNGSALNVLTINDAGPASISGSVAGASQLVKSLDGTLALTNSGSSFTGTIAVNAGALDLRGSLTGVGGALTLAGGTTLTSSTATGHIANRAVVVPSASSGVVISGLAQLSAAGGTAVEVDGAATLTGNTISGSTTGVRITGSATLAGNTLTGDGTGIAVMVGGQLTLGAGNKITASGANTVGLLVTGPGAQIVGLSLNNTAFSGFTGAAGAFYAELTNQAEQGPQFIDATQATFAGKAGASLTAAALQSVESQLYDYHVDSGVGLFQLKKGGVFAGGTNLTIIGTDLADTINVNGSNPSSVSVSASFLPQGISGFDAHKGRVIIFALGGNDTINVTGPVETEIHGGDGNDTIYGSTGHNIIFGDAGNDTIIGRGTADVLVGGGGQDILMAMGGQDILIAGSLSAAYNTYSFLNQMRAEWLDTSNTTKAMLHDLAANGMTHPDLPSERCLLSHSGGGPSAFVYRKKGTNTDKVYGLTSSDTDLGF
jgi:autotransporter-associated beta strand protein